jgi:prophage regulatory protein
MRQIRSGTDRRASRQPQRLLRLHEVINICGLGRSKIYQAIRADAFPAPVKLFGRSSAWVSSEIDAWVTSVVQGRDGHPPEG